MYWNYTDEERLFEAFRLAENNPKLFKKFFSELFTTEELNQFVKKFKAMCLLKDLASYSNIRSITGLSPNTIAKLSKTVSDRKSGFREIIEKFEEQGKSYSE